MHNKIPVSQPTLAGNEIEYVNDCLRSNWISSIGKYIERFEGSFAEYCHVEHALACSNGTVALHLALMALGVGPGDEVIVPSLTFVATANAVAYCGATPIFIDSETESWNLNPALLESLITHRTKGIVVVHLYGLPAEMDEIVSIARKHDLFVIEDAAEAHGAEYKGKRVGSIGDIATFSFYGNKIITTGEGGMVLTNDDRLADRVRRLKGQGLDPNKRYYFSIIGYNYRMTNIAAAIGLAQLEKIDWHIHQRRRVANTYNKQLEGFDAVKFQAEQPRSNNVFWMTSITISDRLPITRDQLIEKLSEQGIETRPFFYPVHLLPMYKTASSVGSLPVAENISRQGLNLPSFATLSEDDIIYICDQIKSILSE